MPYMKENDFRKIGNMFVVNGQLKTQNRELKK